MLIVVLVVVCGGIIGDRATASPQQLPLHPLSAQFDPAVAGYAAGYGYDGVQRAVRVGPAAVSVKAVHYADAPNSIVGYAPTVVGYAPSAVYKPDLSAYASFPQVEQLRRFNPVVRPVHTVVPKVTAVEPSVTVHKTYVDVPVPVPVHHEYRPTVVVQDPSPNYNYYQVVDRK